MQTLKQSKLTATYTIPGHVPGVRPVHGVITAECEFTHGNGKKEHETYTVRQVTETAFVCRSVSVGASNERYTVDPMAETCGCTGREKGYLCRHLRLVGAMIKKGHIG